MTRQKKFISSLFIFFAIGLFSLTGNALAQEISDKQPNNKFGIHLTTASDDDLENAADLVNSSGGDWGYVTLVIEEKDRDRNKWQGIFDKLRFHHLIPIVRLATSFQKNYWREPSTQDAAEWASFLNSLNWVIKNRYLVLFNEPNHGAEWGGEVNPEAYGQVAISFAKKLKSTNPDFFILLAGFDSAAPSQPPKFEDQEKFLKKMLGIFPTPDSLFKYIDGWASHSYPNHGFIGLPGASGRNSVKNYVWEMALLRKLGVKQELPVFITETGWPHQEGKETGNNYYPAIKVAENFRVYFGVVIKDPKVTAITPFVLNYQDEPFDHFSWQKLARNDFYPQYDLMQKIVKEVGNPTQEQKLTLTGNLPVKIIQDSVYQIGIEITNEGQAIWSRQDGYRPVLKGLPDDYDYFFSDLSPIYPFQKKSLYLYLKTGEQIGRFDLNLSIAKAGQLVTNVIPWKLEVINQAKITIAARAIFRPKTSAGNFRLLIYDNQERVIFEANDVNVSRGKGEISGVKNLVIGQRYRLVILRPFYLPRQTYVTISEDNSQIVFKPMLPVDYNLDGKLSLADLVKIIKHPGLLKVWWQD
ncbi:MAG TPA: hypothetical protein VMW41_04640 [Candidatus Bathyarchaeia archaeon]|nr:hypothetical protein [Candidatus Bathyarchaeia archaeon]